MDLIHYFLEFLGNPLLVLTEIIRDYGLYIYLFLFLVIFVETGVVVMPLLPGDSLLLQWFNCFNYRTNRYLHRNSFAYFGKRLLGDNVNYFVGKIWRFYSIQRKILFLKKSHIRRNRKDILKKMAVKRSFWRDLSRL